MCCNYNALLVYKGVYYMIDNNNNNNLYLIHPLAIFEDFNKLLNLTDKIVKYGYNVKSVITNTDYNGESLKNKPVLNYEFVIKDILSADIIVINYSNGKHDEVEFEIGVLLGMFEAGYHTPTVYIYTDKYEMLSNSLNKGFDKMFNRLILGGMSKYFTVLDNRLALYEVLSNSFINNSD